MRAVLFLLLGLFSTQLRAAQDGEIDPQFGVDGFVHLDTVPVGGVPTNDRGQFVARLADGRLLVAAHAQQSNVQRAVTVVLSANGQEILASQQFPLDFSNGIIDPPTRGFGLDGAGALYIAGTSSISGSPQSYVLKILPPLYFELDPSWGNNGIATLAPFTTRSYLNAMHVAADGKVVLCGDGQLPDGPLTGFCTRLSTSGAIDSSFAAGFFTINETNVRLNIVQSIAPSAGGYLIAGQATLSDGLRYNLIAKLAASGNLDSSFCASCTDSRVKLSAPGYRVDVVRVNFSCPRIAQRPDGQIVRVGIDFMNAGSSLTYSAYAPGGAAIRYLSEFFPSNPNAYRGCDNLLSVQPDNKVVFAHTLALDSVQYASLRRFGVEPGLNEPNDPAFAGSARYLRASLPGSVQSELNECSYALVEPTGILCVGLTRISSSPLNLDIMLTRVRNGTPEGFANGFE